MSRRESIESLLVRATRCAGEYKLREALGAIDEALGVVGSEWVEYERIKDKKHLILAQVERLVETVESALGIATLEELVERKGDVERALDVLQTLDSGGVQELEDRWTSLKRSLYEGHLSKVKELIEGKQLGHAFDHLEEARRCLPGEQPREMSEKYELLSKTAEEEAGRILQLPPRSISPADYILVEEAIEVIDRSGTNTADMASKWSELRWKAERTRVNRFRSHLGRVHDLIDKGQLNEAEETLCQAGRYVFDGKEVSEIEGVRRKIEKQRQVYTRTYLLALDRILAKGTGDLTDFDIPRGDAILEKLKAITAEPLEIEIRQEQWRECEERRKALLAVSQVSEELRGIWEASCLMLSEYARAVERARDAAQEYEEFQEAHYVAQGLLADAEQKHREAQERERELTDLAAVGDFKLLITELSRLAERYERLPKYVWYGGNGATKSLQQQGELPAREAIQWLRTLAQEDADERASSLLTAAREQLPSNALESKRLLDQTLELTFASEDIRGDIQLFRERHVEPELQRISAHVQSLLEKVDRLREEHKVEDAWRLTVNARRQAPHLEETGKALEAMKPIVEARLENRLGKILQRLRDNEVEEAQGLIEQVKEDSLGFFETVFDQALLVETLCEAHRRFLREEYQQAYHMADEVLRETQNKQGFKAVHRRAKALRDKIEHSTPIF